MEICGCKPKCDCTVFALVSSAVVGIITAFLNFSGTIAVPQVILWVFFGVALGFLAVSFVTGAFAGERDCTGCICNALRAFFAGIFGTVLLTVILLIADIATAGILGSIITGLLFAAFALTVTSAACVVKALFGCR